MLFNSILINISPVMDMMTMAAAAVGTTSDAGGRRLLGVCYRVLGDIYFSCDVLHNPSIFSAGTEAVAVVVRMWHRITSDYRAIPRDVV